MPDPIITNTRGKIASAIGTNTEAQFYVVPAATEIDGLLRVCNTSASAVTYQVAHCDAAHGDNAATIDDFLFYDKLLEAKDTDELSVHLKATETLRIKASVGSVVAFHLSGNKKVIS